MKALCGYTHCILASSIVLNLRLRLRLRIGRRVRLRLRVRLFHNGLVRGGVAGKGSDGDHQPVPRIIIAGCPLPRKGQSAPC